MVGEAQRRIRGMESCGSSFCQGDVSSIIFLICDRQTSKGSVAVQGDASFVSFFFWHEIERVMLVSWKHFFSSCVSSRLKSTVLRSVSQDLDVCVTEPWFCILQILMSVLLHLDRYFTESRSFITASVSLVDVPLVSVPFGVCCFF